MRVIGRLVVAAVAILSWSGTALAHVTVWPRESTKGARERYTVRMPNEKDVATIRVEARFPPEVQVLSFEQKPGWTIEPRRGPDGRIVGAVWTGVLPPAQFVEFGVLARNPKAADSIAWAFIQTYEGGVVVEWTGPAGSAAPASVVTLKPPAAPLAHTH